MVAVGVVLGSVVDELPEALDAAGVVDGADDDGAGVDGAELEGAGVVLVPVELELLWCEVPWLVEPERGSTYWLSPAEPPASAIAGMASTSTASTARQITNWRQAVTG